MQQEPKPVTQQPKPIMQQQPKPIMQQEPKPVTQQPKPIMQQEPKPVTQQQQPKPVFSVTKPKISDNVKGRIREYMNKVKQKKNNMKCEQVKQFCKKKEALLDFPLITRDMSYTFTYTSTPLERRYNVKDIFNLTSNNKNNITTYYKHPIFYNHNNYTPNNNEKVFLQFEENNIDIDWFNKNDKYISSLSLEDKFTVHGYTYHGDRFVNNYLLNKFQYPRFMTDIKNNINLYKTDTYFPLFFQTLKYYDINKYDNIFSVSTYKSKFEAIKKSKLHANYVFVLDSFNSLKKHSIEKIIQMYTNDLKRIISDAPKTTKKMIVYRGVKNDYYFKNREKDVFFKNKNFVSTSFNPKTAKNFKGDVHECCLSQITLLPGTCCIWLSAVSRIPSENELLLDSDTTYLIRSHKKELHPINRRRNICEMPHYNLSTISEIVAL